MLNEYLNCCKFTNYIHKIKPDKVLAAGKPIQIASEVSALPSPAPPEGGPSWHFHPPVRRYSHLGVRVPPCRQKPSSHTHLAASLITF